jgi:hypothetical protein
MTQRLMAAHTVSEAELSALAQARAEAVTQALRDSAKVDPARIATAAPRAIAGDADRSVPTSLELGLAK